MTRSNQPFGDASSRDNTAMHDAQTQAIDGKPLVSEPLIVSNMSYSEMVGFFHQQLGRVEMAWFRIMYLHAAIVGVLVFFGEADDFLLLQRLVVFGFFTVNLVIFHVALSEGYAGLDQAQKDLERFPASDGHVDQWFRSRKSLNKSKVRTMVMVTTWLLVGFLLFRSLIAS